MHARVVVRQDGRTLAEVPLEARVVKQSLTVLVGGLSLVLPFVLLLLKHFRLDFESQLADGFSLYAQIAGWLLRSLTPETLTGLLLTVTAVLYLCLRPRRREVFWDIRSHSAQEPATRPVEQEPVDREKEIERARRAFARGDRAEGERRLVALLEVEPFFVPALLCLADGRYRFDDHAGSLLLYQRVMVLGSMKPIHYFRASLAASKLGDNARALAILEQAEAMLPPPKMKGAMWYNMGCFAARLGRYPDALGYLNQAVNAGYDDIDKLRSDPDLEAAAVEPRIQESVGRIGPDMKIRRITIFSDVPRTICIAKQPQLPLTWRSWKIQTLFRFSGFHRWHGFSSLTGSAFFRFSRTRRPGYAISLLDDIKS